MRRRFFNLFAFALLAFVIYLVAFSKDDNLKQANQTVQVMNNENEASN